MGRPGRLVVCAALLLAGIDVSNASAREPAPSEGSSPAAAEIEALASAEQEAYDRGDYETSASLGLKLYELRKSVLGTRDPLTIEAHDNYGVAIGNLGRNEDALKIHRVTSAMGREVNGPDHPDTLFYLSNLAGTLRDLDRSEEALPLHREAWERRSKTLGPADAETLHSLESYAETLFSLGRQAEAEPLYGQAASLRQSDNPDGPDALDKALLNHANTLAALRKFEAAAQRYDALAEQRAARSGADHEDVLATRILAAEMLLNANRADAALEIASDVRARAIATLGPDHLTTLSAGNNLGLVLTTLGRADEAEPILRETVTRLRARADSDDLALLQVLNNYAANLAGLGRETEAIRIVAEMVEIARSSDIRDKTFLATTLNNYGRLRLSLNDAAGAEPILREAAATSIQAFGIQHPDTLAVRGNLADALIAQGRHEEAAALLAELMQQHADAPNAGLPLAKLQYQMGASMLLRARYADADPYLRDGYEGVRDFYGDTHRETLTALGLHAVNQIFLEHFDEGLRLTRALVDAVRTRRYALGFDPRSQAQSDRIIAGRTNEFIILASIDLLLAIQQPERRDELHSEALRAMQEISGGSASRAVAMMAARRQAERSGGLGDLARERQALADQWLELEAEMTANLSDVGTDAALARPAMEERLRAIEERMAVVDAKIRKVAPEYYALIRPEPLTLAQVQALLGPEEAAVLMAPGPFGTLVFAVTDEGLQAHRSDLTTEDLDNMVATLRVDLDPTSLAWRATDKPSFDRTLAHELYGALLQPIEDALAGKRHLFVAATGPLSSLPPAVLVVEPPPGEDDDPQALRDTQWLADRHALVQIPSLQSLQFLRSFGVSDETTGSAMRPFAGYGDPQLSGKGSTRGARGMAGAVLPGKASALVTADTRGTATRADPEALRALSELPGTRRELEDIRKALGAAPASVRTGAAATESAVRTDDLSDVSVIAFATHALMPGELAGLIEPGLILTPPKTASADNDGYLAASEVATLKLAAQWVILSACNTAAGGDAGGEALSGLARAFFYAGARSLLASHWPVFDDVAPVLTAKTIRLRREQPGMSRAVALQHAMRDLREGSGDPLHAHPAAWAPFSLVGDAD